MNPSTAPARASDPQKLRQELAAYLRAISAIVGPAAEAQNAWAPQLQRIFADSKVGAGQAATLRALAVGRQYGQLYRDGLRKAESLQSPPSALRCQEYLVRWLKALANAADALAQAPEDGKDTAYLRDAHDYLDDARYAVKPFSDLRQRLHELAQPTLTTAAPRPAARL